MSIKFYTIVFFFIGFKSMSQNPEWTCLPFTPNDEVTHLDEYKDQLIIGGYFKNIDGVQANGIVAWDGTQIINLSKGIRSKKGYPHVVANSLVFNNELYVVGYFDSAGDYPSKCIAKWDGNSWYNFNNGANNDIQHIIEYKNEIYVSGSFDSIGGISAKCIAKWDGNNWHALSQKIVTNSINRMHVYKDQLYFSGAIDSFDGKAASFLRWDGMNVDTVSYKVRRGNVMITWKDKLLIGTQNKIINNVIYRQFFEWDGVKCNLFSQQSMFTVSELIQNKGLLYCAGGVETSSKNSNVRYYDTTQKLWLPIGKGLNNGVASIFEFNKELYAAGSFKKKDSGICDFIAKLEYTTNLKHEKTTDITYQCYFQNQFLNIQSPNTEPYHIVVYNFNGQLLHSEIIYPTQEKYTINKPFDSNFMIVKITTIQQSRTVFLQKLINVY